MEGEGREVWYAEGRNLFWAPNGSFEASLTSLPFALDNCVSSICVSPEWPLLCRLPLNNSHTSDEPHICLTLRVCFGAPWKQGFCFERLFYPPAAGGAPGPCHHHGNNLVSATGEVREKERVESKRWAEWGQHETPQLEPLSCFRVNHSNPETH